MSDRKERPAGSDGDYFDRRFKSAEIQRVASVEGQAFLRRRRSDHEIETARSTDSAGRKYECDELAITPGRARVERQRFPGVAHE